MKKSQLIILFSLLINCGNIFSQIDNRNTPEFQSELINPERIIKVGENHYFFDFGKDAFGTLQFLAKSELKDSIIVHLGEQISKPNTINRNPEGTIRYQRLSVSDIQINKPFLIKLTANKRNSNPPAIILPDSFGIIMPFRYCEIENLCIPIEDLSVKQKTYNYRFNEKSSDFSCSDTVLNQVWDMCKYTIKATSFCGVYVDGDRERIPYEADAFINQLSHYCVDSVYTIARKTNEYFIDNPTWPTEWILHTVLLFYYDYLYTGDLKPLAQNYEALKTKTLYELQREDGLISSKSDKITNEYMKKLGFKNEKQRISDIVDWPPAQKDTGWKLSTAEGERDGYEMVDVNTVVNSFQYINLKLMAIIAEKLGKKEDSAFFYSNSIKVKDAINEKLFDKSRGVYVDGENSTHASIHSNMFPLAFGIVPENWVKSVSTFIKSRGMACSVYGAQYLLEALYIASQADYALSLMTAQNDRCWWNMIKAGSTMALEAWDIKYKPNLDWNHAWGTAPANIITRYMWGITPSLAGFDKVEIKPQLSHLTFCKIKVPTIKGIISAEYKVVNKNTKLYLIEIPKGMKGEFVLLKHENAKIYLDSKKIKSGNGNVPLKQGLNRIEIR